MRMPSLLASAVLCSAALSASAAPATSPRQASESRMLRGAACLDPSYARNFVDLDRRTLLVDAGRNHYLIEVSPACWNLGTASVVGFRGDPVSNRVCGAALDAVLVRGSAPCRIERMRLIGRDEYRQALRDREAWRKQRQAERAAAKQH